MLSEKRLGAVDWHTLSSGITVHTVSTKKNIRILFSLASLSCFALLFLFFGKHTCATVIPKKWIIARALSSQCALAKRVAVVGTWCGWHYCNICSDFISNNLNSKAREENIKYNKRRILVIRVGIDLNVYHTSTVQDRYNNSVRGYFNS